MKLISLNVWCGVKYEELKRFLKYQSRDTDIFCFQEVRNGKYLNQDEKINEKDELFQEIKILLPDFTGYFVEMVPGVGIATFIRNGVELVQVKSAQILTAKDLEHLPEINGVKFYPRMLQSLYLKDKNLIIHNFHGIPKGNKKDTPERDLQTQRLLEIIDSNDAPQILVGDFNLSIDTEAITRLESRMQNLIKRSEFKTTRNSNYKYFRITPFADYIFVSRDIKVNKFIVLPDEVSDHLALLLNFT